MSDLAIGTLVKAGFTLCRIVDFRKGPHGIDGVLVVSERLAPGDGYLPHWTPLSTITREV